MTKALKVLMKNVQPTEDVEVDENELEDMLVKAKEQQDKEYLESAKAAKSSKAKVYSLQLSLLAFKLKCFYSG